VAKLFRADNATMNWAEAPQVDYERMAYTSDDDDLLGVTEEETEVLRQAGEHYREKHCFTESECNLMRDLKIRGISEKIVRGVTDLCNSQIRRGFKNAQRSY
jgi:predicted small metal-binding protein